MKKNLATIRVGLLGAFGVLVTICSSASAAHEACPGPAQAAVDGIPAYAMCGHTSIYSDNGVSARTSPAAGWTETDGGGGFQCVELANRYMHFKFGIDSHWGIQIAAQMCERHPAGVETVSAPVHGDLMVFPKSPGHPDGHVAIVDAVQGNGKVTIVQQNKLPYREDVDMKLAGCWLHAVDNNDCGSAANGQFCGESPSVPRGERRVLYHCKDHQVESKTECKYTCGKKRAGAVDECGPKSTAR